MTGHRRLKARSLCGAALSMLLCVSIPPFAAQTAQDGHAAASVSTNGQGLAGRVVSQADGHPIPNAVVTLAPQQQRNGRRQGVPPGAMQTAQTDAEGRYQLPPQPAGRYTLRASAPGYLGSLYLEHEGYSSAIVTGAGLPTDNLSFALVPEASLHGRVLDDTGEPVRANVRLFREVTNRPGTADGIGDPEQRFRPTGGTQADEDGVYDFPNLQPGRYYVAVTATPWYAVHARPIASEDRLPYRTAIDPSLDVAYPLTFYPHATTEQEASAIVLAPGQRAAANMVLQAEHAVTLTVQMPSTDGAAQGGMQPYPSLFYKAFGQEQSIGAPISGRVGDTVTITGVAPGQYGLRAFGRRGDLGQSVPVNLSSGSATVPLPTGSTGASTDLSITLRAAAGAELNDDMEVSLQRVGGGWTAAPLENGKVEKGVAHFPDVSAGQYRVVLRKDGQMWNVVRLSVDGKTVPSKLLRLSGGTVRAEVTASQYAPEVEGVVHGAEGNAHPGSLVVLVPAGADSGADLFRADQSDLDGGFQFFNVLPGNYLLVAVDNDWKLDWHNATALLPYLTHALPVVVPGSGPRTVLLREPAIAQQK